MDLYIIISIFISHKYFFICPLSIKTMFPRTEEYTYLDEEDPLASRIMNENHTTHHLEISEASKKLSDMQRIGYQDGQGIPNSTPERSKTGSVALRILRGSYRNQEFYTQSNYQSSMRIK